MRIAFHPALFLACLMLAVVAPPSLADQPDAGYGARSLRGLTALHVEVVGESAPAAPKAAEAASDDPIKLLEGLLKSKPSKKEAAPPDLAGDAKSALASRTTIKLHEGSLEAARAAGTAYLLVTVQDGPADPNGKSPYDLTLELRQQVALARDPKLTFYATTYDDRISEPAGGRRKSEVLGVMLDRFVEFWRAGN